MNVRKLQLSALLFILVVLAMFALGELTIRIFSPTEYLYPRYQHSAHYGLIPFADVRMVHGVPGKYQFHYTINHDHCRGENVPESGGAPAVVALGDSYTFGMGVDDGQEYTAVMREILGDKARVVNLASPGWGLTQQIRRYYEYGTKFSPKVVILQFCGNDPADNFNYRVTGVDNGDFVFRESEYSGGIVKRLLSRSWIQRSQLYNFFRARAALAMQNRFVRSGEKKFQKQRAESPDIPPGEALYIELLETFAKKLHADGIPLIMISVDEQLDGFKHIRASADSLSAQGDLVYLEVLSWLGDAGEYRSPEGHIWGARAHRIIGEHLAAYLLANQL